MSGSASPEAKEIARDLAALRGPAMEAVMLDDLQNTLRDERASVRKHNGQPDRKEDDVIHLGDTTIIHPSASASSPVAANDWFKKAAVAASLLGAGSVVGAGIPWLVGAFDKSDVPVITVPANDLDTRYELHIGAER